MIQKMFDKVVEIVSPERAVRREAARRTLKVLNTGYSNHGASRSKKSLIGWNYKGGSQTMILLTTWTYCDNALVTCTWGVRWLLEH